MKKYLSFLFGFVFLLMFAFIGGKEIYAQNTIPLSSCGNVTNPGTYTVTQNLSTNGACLQIINAKDITINCQGKQINGAPSFKIENSENIKFESCTFDSTISSFASANKVLKSKNITFIKNIFNSKQVDDTYTLRIDDSSNSSFLENTVYGKYEQHYSKNMIIKDNIFTFPKTNKLIIGVINLIHSSGSQAINNFIDGNSDTRQTSVGVDDGIYISGETGGVFSNNNIKNVWDCGIETTNPINNSKFENNTIKNTGICGIGGWYTNSLTNNVFNNNFIDDSPKAFDFYRAYGLNEWYDGISGQMVRESKIYFNNNTFSGNTFINPRNSTYSSAFMVEPILSVSVAGQKIFTANDIVTSNNVFANNNFGTGYAPFFSKTLSATDGGGNVCNQPGTHAYYEPNYPIKCQSAGSVVTSCPVGTTGTYPNCVTSPVSTPSPTVTFTANPISVSSGGSTNLTWNTTNATTCTAGGGWTGSKSLNGSQTISNLQSTGTYTLTCANQVGEKVTKSLEVGVLSNPIVSCPVGTSGTYPNCIKNPDPVDPTPTSSCVDLSTDIKFGDKNNEVTKLQSFLKSKGYFTENPTGYFGPITLQAVKDFQKANNISPAEGYVGSITRAKIKALTCGDLSGSICDYAAPPTDCKYIQGPNYNSNTQCGLVLQCVDDVKVCPTGTTGIYPNCVNNLKPTVTVTSPNGGESWKVGDNIKISWSTINAPTDAWVALSLEKSNKQSQLLAQKLTLNGSYSHLVSDSFCSGDVCYSDDIGGDYKIVARLYTGAQELCGGFCYYEPGTRIEPILITEDSSNSVFKINLKDVCPKGTTGTYPNCVSDTQTISCLELSFDLKYGDKNNEVTKLQTFLKSKGYFTENPTGFFGTVTEQSVIAFQKANNISPAAGYVGSITRAKIKALTCEEISTGNCFDGIKNGNETSIDRGGSCGGDPVCPQGTIGTYPDCKSDETRSCPVGFTGTYPNCVYCQSAPGSSGCIGIEPKPTVTLTANPTSVYPGGSTSLSWSSTNAISCTASGDWTGNKGESGANVISGLSTNKTFNLTCVGLGGEVISKSVDVKIYQHCQSAPGSSDCIGIELKPTINLTANPTSVSSGGSTSLSWSSTNAISCTAGSTPANTNWTGTKSISGNQTLSNLQSTTTYTLTCSNQSGEKVSKSVDVGVYIVDDFKPSVTVISPNGGEVYEAGQQITVKWETKNIPASDKVRVDLLVAPFPPGFNGINLGNTLNDGAEVFTLPQSSSFNGSPMSFGKNFKMHVWNVIDSQNSIATSDLSDNLFTINNFSCPIGTTGTYPNCVTTVTPKPTVTISANPDSLENNKSTTLTWSSTNTTSCTASASPSTTSWGGTISNGWTGVKATSGSQVISNLQTTTTFTLTCVGSTGEKVSKSVDVGVYIVDVFPNPVCPTGTTGTYPNCIQASVPKLTFTSNPSGIESGKSSTLTWTSTNATSCLATGGWTGTKATNGSQVISNITEPTTYTLTCTGPGGGTIAQTEVNVYIVDDFKPSIVRTYPKGGETFNPGETIKVTWESKNLGNRLVNVGLNYNKYESGYNYVESVIKLDLPNTGETSITIPSAAELKALGIFTNSFGINVWVHELVNGQYENIAFDPIFKAFKINIPCDAGQTGTYPNCITPISTKPTISITASPTSVQSGGSTTLTWSTANMSSCKSYSYPSNSNWLDGVSRNQNGSQVVSNLTNFTSFFIECNSSEGVKNASVSITTTSPTTTTTSLTATNPYFDGCTSYKGYSATTGRLCYINDLGLSITPYVALLSSGQAYFKTLKGDWHKYPEIQTNIDTTNSANLVNLCNKFYSGATRTSLGGLATIDGNKDVPIYQCWDAKHVSLVLGASTEKNPNLCSLDSTLLKGMKSKEVKCLQQKLNQKGYKVVGTEGGKETTEFGYYTMQALRKFQKENNLKADGILGLQTRALLNK